MSGCVANATMEDLRDETVRGRRRASTSRFLSGELAGRFQSATLRPRTRQSSVIASSRQATAEANYAARPKASELRVSEVAAIDCHQAARAFVVVDYAHEAEARLFERSPRALVPEKRSGTGLRPVRV